MYFKTLNELNYTKKLIKKYDILPTKKSIMEYNLILSHFSPTKQHRGETISSLSSNKILPFIYADNVTNIQLPKVVFSPREVVLGANVEHQIYCHLLCGLRNSESIDGIFFPLIQEIVDSEMRNYVIDVLGGPQLDLSKIIPSVCEEKNWGGLLEIPLLRRDYFALECCVAINLDIVKPPKKTWFVMFPTAAYFEFLPFDYDQIDVFGDQTIACSGVEIGEMYEVVVTTYRRLYRCRLGYITRFVGFFILSPQVEYVMRAPNSLSDIITERELMVAMESSQVVLREEISIEITDFLDMELIPKRLKIFVEVREGDTSILQESIEVIKRICSLFKYNLEVFTMLRGKTVNFNQLAKEAMDNGSPASQYRSSKIIRNHEIICLLERYALVTVCLNSMDN
ncbi:hypothetical protein UlMin_016036 [Ulmus minor]